MVKLKVQSAQDIVAACLDCLGLKKADAATLLNSYDKLSAGADIPTEIDEIIYHKAKKIYKTKLPKIQLVALFKAVFIKLKMAEKYGVSPLLPNFENTEFTNAMANSYIETAPTYKLAVMPTQEISPLHFHKAKKTNQGEKQ